MKKKQVMTMTMVVMTAVISGKYGIFDYSAAAKPPVRKNGNHLSG